MPQAHPFVLLAAAFTVKKALGEAPETTATSRDQMAKKKKKKKKNLVCLEKDIVEISVTMMATDHCQL